MGSSFHAACHGKPAKRRTTDRGQNRQIVAGSYTKMWAWQAGPLPSGTSTVICASLRLLFERLPELTPEDTVVFLGDYIDRGPDSAGVVAWVREFTARSPAKVIALRGNHEDAWLQVVDQGWPEFVFPRGNGCLETLRSFIGGELPDEDEVPTSEELEEMFAAKFLPADVVAWMREMPFFYEDEHAIYVHAGIKRSGDGFPHPSEVDPQRALLVAARSRLLRELPRQARRVRPHDHAHAAERALDVHARRSDRSVGRPRVHRARHRVRQGRLPHRVRAARERESTNRVANTFATDPPGSPPAGAVRARARVADRRARHAAAARRSRSVSASCSSAAMRRARRRCRSRATSSPSRRPACKTTSRSRSIRPSRCSTRLRALADPDASDRRRAAAHARPHRRAARRRVRLASLSRRHVPRRVSDADKHASRSRRVARSTRREVARATPSRPARLLRRCAREPPTTIRGTRGFYQLAERTHARAWTEPYTFFTSHETGITCTEPIYDASHGAARGAHRRLRRRRAVARSSRGPRSIRRARSSTRATGTMLAYPAADQLALRRRRPTSCCATTTCSDPALDALLASRTEPPPAPASEFVELPDGALPRLGRADRRQARRRRRRRSTGTSRRSSRRARCSDRRTRLERSSVIAIGGALRDRASALALCSRGTSCACAAQVAASRAEARSPPRRARASSAATGSSRGSAPAAWARCGAPSTGCSRGRPRSS